MTEPVFWPGLVAALALPWCAGAALVYAMLRPTGRFNLPLVFGQGYLLGVLLTTLVIRAWDSAAPGLSFAGLCAALLAVTGLGCLVLARRPGLPAPRQTGGGSPLWQHAISAGLLGLLAWRYGSLLQELLGRPLYAWDAWVNWSPKAIVWFHQGELTEFLRPDRWLRQETADAYTLGNWRASNYPETVPLFLLWTMLGAQTTAGSALYLPWLLAPLALGLGFYGHLRLAGLPAPGAVIAVYALLSLPYLNVHTALAGYADIWLACAFGLSVCALYEWRSTGRWAWAALSLLLAALCAQLKNPGIVLGLIAALCAAWGAVSWRPRRLLAAGAALLGLVVILALTGIDVPGLGRIALEAGQIEAGRLGRFELAYHPVAGELADTTLVQRNWHLFWYALAGFALYRLWRRPVLRPPPAEWLAAVTALAFVLFVFMFTPHYRAAEDQTTLNRALLYTVAPLLFCAALAWHRRCARAPVTQVSEKITTPAVKSPPG